MQNKPSTVVVLGTGGTIAGTSADASDNVGYTAGQVAASALVQAVPALAAAALDVEQLAQIDSKDMSHALWSLLARRCAHHLARADVAGIVVTHGTDTLEETAWFLQRVLAPSKPVVLTAAMRPSTALLSDGPQNLLDAVTVARTPGAGGVVVVLSGTIHGARDVRKVHSYRVDAFNSGDAGSLGVVEEGAVRMFRAWPGADAVGVGALNADIESWPRVEIVMSHAGATGAVVQALRASGVHGIVVAATGNGTVHQDLEAALTNAQRAGVQVLRSTRCGNGRVLAGDDAALASADDLTPVKARVELMLRLMTAARQ